MNRPEEWGLFEQLEDGRISESDFDHLQQRLLEDPELRQAYRAYVDMSYALENISDSEAERAWHEEFKQQQKEPLLKFPLVLYTALAACLAIIFWINWPKTVAIEENIVKGAMETGFARIAMSAGVEWSDQQFDDGNYLKNQRININSGLLNLEFDNGADIVIEGPAEFQLISDMKMQVFNGKLRANIPEAAHGFTIETEKLDVVDLGTEFGVEVSDGKMNVQVFDGEVKLVKENKDLRSMTEGDAVIIESATKIQDTEFASDKYIGKDQFILLRRGLRNKAYTRWFKFAETLQQHPDLMAYYYFFNERKWDHLLPNKKLGVSEATYGEIIGAKRVPGRFDTEDIYMPNSALLFNRQNSRVRIDLPETVAAMTMMCWVNIESTENNYSTFLQSLSSSQGSPGWFLLNNGKMLFSIKRPGDIVRPINRELSFLSPKVWTPGMRDIWIHLAVSIDQSVIRYYRNGRLISETPHKLNYKQLKIGRAELGNNFRLARDRQKAQNLHGKMDEYLIFKRALSELEIKEIYTKGNVE